MVAQLPLPNGYLQTRMDDDYWRQRRMREEAQKRLETEMSKKVAYVPMTPGGTLCMWLAAKTEDKAWEKLLEDAAHMPYKGKEGFKQRGYKVVTVKE